MQLCRGFSSKQWDDLSRLLTDKDDIAGDEHWELAINIFSRRMSERFLSCIEALETADSKLDVDEPDETAGDEPRLPTDPGFPVVVPGFAIMALCCLLMEALQSFRNLNALEATTACENGSPQEEGTKNAIVSFLMRPSFGDEFANDVGRRFVNGIRNGILHNAETRRWAIWREYPPGRMVKDLSTGQRYEYGINRKLFYAALKAEFVAYLDDLRSNGNMALRARFITKMNHISKT